MSNAIVFADAHMTLGAGAGQLSRIDSASRRSRRRTRSCRCKARWSPATHSFRLVPAWMDVVVDASATAVIQPGGNLRDDEVIKAANERRVVMAFKGTRYSRH